MTLSLIATTPASTDNLAVLARFACGLDELCYGRSVGGCGHHQLIRIPVLAGNLVSINQSISSCTFLLTGRISSDSEGR